MLNTPRLFDASLPAALSLPTAPRDAPATPVVELTVECGAASHAPAAVLVTEPTALPAAEVRPPPAASTSHTQTGSARACAAHRSHVGVRCRSCRLRRCHRLDGDIKRYFLAIFEDGTIKRDGQP